MTQDAKIGLFCSADALAKAVEEALSGGEVAAATRLTGFAEVLEFIEEEVPTVVLLSMADLCVEGLDAINLVDMQLGMHQHVTPVLLVEPWVAQELVSITVMTGLKVSVPSNDVHTDLVGLLHEVCPALRSPAPSAKVPLKMDDAAGEGDEPGDVIVRELDGVTSGRLEEVWLPRLLYILSVCEFTGSLTLTSSPRSLKVYLRDGRVGDLEQGDHKPLLSAFAWSKGTYRCKPGDIDSASFCEYGTTSELIYDGCMEFVSTNQAAQRLSHYEVFYPVCSQFVTERSELLETQDVLRRFCLSCDGSRTWSQVISATWPEVRRVLKSAIFAIETDLVLMLPHASTETVTVRYRLPAQEGTAGASTGDAPGVDPQDEIRTLARLRSRLQNFDRIDAYSIFGLKPGCGVQAVRKQFYRLVKQHHPDVFGGSTSAEIQVTAELVFIHIKDAHVELVNLEQNHDGGGNRIVKPSERVVSRVRSKEAATKTAQKAREELQASAPSVSRTTRSRSVRRKTAPPPPPSSEVVALGDEAGSDQKVRTRSPSTRESVRSKIRPAKPARRAVRAPAGTIASVRARSSESRSTKRSSEAPGAKVTAEEQRRQMMSKLPATKHFQNGKKALQGKQYDRAREAFRYAVEAEESNAEFRAYFAYSRYLADPTEVGRVVRMLQDCLSLDGRHVEVHLFLARIAKAEGDLHSALDSYEQVLKRDRKNIEAQREIRLSRMRQGGGKDETEQGKAGPGADGSFFSKLFNRKKDT